MAREINLVPDVKNEMIKALKMRNFIFFLCAIVSAISIGVVAIFGAIAGGQGIAIDNKKATIDALSSKINSYSDLSEFLTIKDQLGNISTITQNKQVLSRTFNILRALLPTGADTITVSELSVNLAANQPTFTFDAQADASKEMDIDFAVLDAFEKSMQYMHYDYGDYVDRNGQTIPAYCIIETGTDGAFFRDSSKGFYAYWTIDAEGCKSANSDSNNSYTTENYEGQNVVRIWRTPQYGEWYKEREENGQPYMSLNGNISNVPHFESKCYTYTGDNSQNSSSPKWTNTNNCLLVPAGTDGITTPEKSNGKDSDGNLVLRFSAVIQLAPEVYNFNNHHMIAIAPSGRRNVTDSYVQLQAMFGERAADCAEGDTTCKDNSANLGEE